MVPRPRNGLSLCAGGGGLDMGLGLAEPGFHTRCYVEWEPYPRETLIAAQAAGYMADAPIWDDVTTFDARPFAGAFDTLVAGYPCQPESLAGKRGLDKDPRWLWNDIARIIAELGPALRWCFFENVASHVSGTLPTVLRTLRDMDFAPAVGLFTAAETGAAHERERVFIVAYRSVFGCEWSQNLRSEQQSDQGERWADTERFGNALADSNGGHRGDEREQCSGEQRFQPEGGYSGGKGDQFIVGHPPQLRMRRRAARTRALERAAPRCQRKHIIGIGQPRAHQTARERAGSRRT